MGDFSLICPTDDAEATQAAGWAKAATSHWLSRSHSKVKEVKNATTPADRTNVEAVVKHPADVVCYFGHGTEGEWTTSGSATLDSTNARATLSKVVVSIACKTGCKLGPSSITAGAKAWLGFTISIAIFPPFGAVDPFEEAFANGLKPLGDGLSVQDTRDEIANQFGNLADDYDTGGIYNSHTNAVLGYFAAIALRDHVVAQGNVHTTPL